MIFSRKAICAVVDQAVSSVTNIGVLVLTARVLTAEDFGRFAFVYIVYTLIIGGLQSLIGQVLVIQEPRDAASRGWASMRFAGLTSLGISALMVVLSVVFVGSMTGSFLALAALLPVIALQDCSRYVFFSMLRPELSLVSDVVWFVVSAPLLVLLQEPGVPALSVLLWGTGAIPALAISLFFLRSLLSSSPAGSLGASSRKFLGYRFLAEYSTLQSGGQASVMALGLIGGVVATGTLRAGSTLMGPINVLFTAAQTFGLSFIRTLERKERIMRASFLLGCSLGVLSLAWSVILFLASDRLGSHILGDSWAGARSVVLFLGAQYLFQGVLVSARMALRLLAPRKTLQLQLANTLLLVIGTFLGFAVGGVVGSAAGIAGAAALEAVVAVVLSFRATADAADVSRESVNSSSETGLA